MVKYLALTHPPVCGIHILRRPYPDTVVHSGSFEAELETEDEIAVLFLGVQISSAPVIGSDIDGPVDKRVILQIACPLRHIRTVKQHFISGSGLIFRQDKLCSRRLESGKDHIDFIDRVSIISTVSRRIDIPGFLKG